jgi:outer membrane receptor protein involved in Fe transport
VDSPTADHSQLNPKAGLLWNVTPDTTLRFAAFRTLKRTLISDQTIEPTEVAGFNQFFDEFTGTDGIRYGAGLDHAFSETLLAGIELTRRELDVPVVGDGVQDVDEQLHRAYLYWAASPRWALAAEYLREDLQRDPGPGVVLVDIPRELETDQVRLNASYHHPVGLFAGLGASYVNQAIEIADAGELVDDEDKFWLFDAALGYRLPGRRGIVSIEARNLFDESFRYFGSDFESGESRAPEFIPERTLLIRFTFAL